MLSECWNRHHCDPNSLTAVNQFHSTISDRGKDRLTSDRPVETPRPRFVTSKGATRNRTLFPDGYSGLTGDLCIGMNGAFPVCPHGSLLPRERTSIWVQLRQLTDEQTPTRCFVSSNRVSPPRSDPSRRQINLTRGS